MNKNECNVYKKSIMSYQFRGISFEKLDKSKRCDVCQKRCVTNEEMVKQFCKCGCGCETFSWMYCPIIDAADYFDDKRKLLCK